jgi:hypothetical protein
MDVLRSTAGITLSRSRRPGGLPELSAAIVTLPGMLTLGTWLGPIIAAIIAIIGIPAGLRIRWRRGRAIQRIAELLAWEDSHGRGYPDEYDTYLEHYLGGRHWQGREASSNDPGSRRTLRGRWRGSAGTA